MDNLVGNAIKLTPVKGHIKTAEKRESGKVQFFVSDSGTSISEKPLDFIFNNIFTLSTLTSGKKDGGVWQDIVIKTTDIHIPILDIMRKKEKERPLSLYYN